jgi:electron transfer flavoprotein alpha/beta subunit
MAAYVHRAYYRQGTLRVERRMDGACERLLLKLPALITVTGRGRRARPMSLGSVEEAFRDLSVSCWTKEDLDVDPTRIGWEGSPTRSGEYAHWEHPRSGEIIQVKAGEAANRILGVLTKKNIIGG